MPDNPQFLSSVPFALPGSDHPILGLGGRDAAAFAQAQFMNDVAGLAVGHWQWNGWLTPKGRVIALFALIKLAEDSLWLVLPDADPGEIAAQLQRFVFRSKVAISRREDLFVACALSCPETASGSTFSGDAESGIELDFSGDGGDRTLSIGTQPPERGDSQDRIVAWTELDYVHGFPRLRASQFGKWTPQQLSLERLRAFSVRKGCYPGQEIVARTHFLGQAKRGLALYAADALPPASETIRDGAREIGTVISAMAQAQGSQLMHAVVALDHGSASLHVDGVALRPLPLSGGLER